MIYDNFSDGIKTSRKGPGFQTIVGCDIYTDPGFITGGFALTRADSVVDALCLSKVTIPNGDTFFGSSTSGKIWKCTPAGVVTLVHTNTNGAILGMGFFNGYLYYASATKLGRIAESPASSEASWSSQSDSWNTFTIGNTSYHPMVEQNLSLFIGDGKYVASVDSSGAFAGNALDLQTQHVITVLFPYENDLVIGTIVGSSNNRSGLFRWDTYSNSWTVEDYVDEVGINCAIPSDDVMFLQIGTAGNIYYYTGSKARKFKKLKDASNIITTGVNAYASGNLDGIPLFGTSRGIHALGRAEEIDPVSQVIAYVPSQGQGTTVGAIATVGSQMFVSYKNGSNYGIDKIDTNRYSGFVETNVYYGEPDFILAHYDSLPSGTSISMSTSVDGEAYTAQTVEKDNEDDRVYKLKDNPGNKSTISVRFTLNASTTTSPTVSKFEIGEFEKDE